MVIEQWSQLGFSLMERLQLVNKISLLSKKLEIVPVIIMSVSLINYEYLSSLIMVKGIHNSEP